MAWSASLLAAGEGEGQSESRGRWDGSAGHAWVGARRGALVAGRQTMPATIIQSLAWTSRFEASYAHPGGAQCSRRDASCWGSPRPGLHGGVFVKQQRPPAPVTLVMSSRTDSRTKQRVLACPHAMNWQMRWLVKAWYLCHWVFATGQAGRHGLII